MFQERGVSVLDADLIARQIVMPGQPAHADIAREWGATVLAGDGQIDRRKLAELIFSDADARRKLESLTHPRISELANRELEQIAERGESFAIYEASLLVETGAYRAFDGLIVVLASDELRSARLQTRDGFTDQEIRNRLAAQLPAADRLAVADYVIRNDGSLAETERQVEAVLADIRRGGPRGEGERADVSTPPHE